MSHLVSFDDALKGATGKKHLLLGNGFSRACRNDIFSYDSLFESADFGKLSSLGRDAFKVLNTTDFEQVMKSMQTAAALVNLYSKTDGAKVAAQLKSDADALRAILVETIAGHHPEMPSQLTGDEYAACLGFLRHFEKIYTVNYDLLLYWVAMKAAEGGDGRDDGFRDPFVGEPEDYVEEEYVEWTNPTHSQNIHYLHGALHLFYDGGCLQKYCWQRTGVRLLEQIDKALKDGLFPLIVAEGDTEQKYERIQRSNYLGHNYRSLGSVTGSLFIYGLSLAENDQHILKQIKRNSSLKKVYVSIYGDHRNEGNKKIIAAAKALSLGRPKTKPLEVGFYSAESAKVWSK